MNKRNIIISLLVLSAILSCKEKIKKQKESFLSSLLINEYKIKPNAILYQYYEKYGFTDICIHTRAYFKYTNFKKEKNWKKLPLSTTDIKLINSFPNKIDSIKNNYSVLYQKKDFYDGIMIETKEHIKDTVFNKRLDLTKGYYKITKNTLEVYNPKTNTLYYEYYKCDE